MTVVSALVIWKLTSLSLKVIRNGGDDESILKDNEKENEKQEDVVRYKAGKALEWVLSCLLFVAFACVFVFSAYVNIRGDVYFEDMPTVKVVYSDSMSKKHEDSEYLFENNLNDQFNAMDLIFVYKAPNPEDLEVYDVIVYQYKDTYVVHRIIEIQEPNERHPDEYWFKTQGDAVGAPDSIVKESQVLAIYRGEKMSYMGSFVLFMQAPIGWLCLLLMFIGAIVTPVIDKKLQKEREMRLEAILFEESQERIAQGKMQQRFAQATAQQRFAQATAQQRFAQATAQQHYGATRATIRRPMPYQPPQPQYIQRIQPIEHIQDEDELPQSIQNMLSKNGVAPSARGPQPIYVPQESIIQRIEDGIPVKYAPIPGTNPIRYVRIAPNPKNSGGTR
jgi:signal peptidase I